ncbi:MAG: response regulator transcription factor [Flavobacteriaceae bacterium]|nr:response regulator transcription factor [Flavobacteriaceae bacterium]
MNLRCVIIDDEPLAVGIIKDYIDKIDGLEVVQTFHNAIESLSFFQENEVDVLFLDINMPTLNGLDFLENLDKKPLVIITTAYEEYALKGYELDVLDYLLKPIPFPRFVKAVNKVFKIKELSENGKNKNQDFIFIRLNKKQLKKVVIDDITTIESVKDYIKISTTKEHFLTHQTLQSFIESLPADKFLRIHRSFVIAIDKIDAIEGNSIIVNNERFTIGRSYLNTVKEVLLHFEIEEE